MSRISSNLLPPPPSSLTTNTNNGLHQLVSSSKYFPNENQPRLMYRPPPPYSLQMGENRWPCMVNNPGETYQHLAPPSTPCQPPPCNWNQMGKPQSTSVLQPLNIPHYQPPLGPLPHPMVHSNVNWQHHPMHRTQPNNVIPPGHGNSCHAPPSVNMQMPNPNNFPHSRPMPIRHPQIHPMQQQQQGRPPMMPPPIFRPLKQGNYPQNQLPVVQPIPAPSVSSSFMTQTKTTVAGTCYYSSQGQSQGKQPQMQVNQQQQGMTKGASSFFSRLLNSQKIGKPSSSSCETLSRSQELNTILPSCKFLAPSLPSLSESHKIFQQRINSIRPLTTSVNPAGVIGQPDPKSWENVLKRLMDNRDTKQVIYMVQICDKKSLYLAGAKYLQTMTDWQTSKEMRTLIIQFYKKAEDRDSLATFLANENCKKGMFSGNSLHDEDYDADESEDLDIDDLIGGRDSEDEPNYDGEFNRFQSGQRPEGSTASNLVRTSPANYFANTWQNN